MGTTTDNKRKQFNQFNAPTFFGMSEQDQRAVLRINTIRRENGAFSTSDYVANVEDTALLYTAQHIAFQNVLTEEGFEPTEEASKGYEGRIAFLTTNGTFSILGKPRPLRYVVMTRIHSPELNHNQSMADLLEDLRLGERPYFNSRGVRSSSYHGSSLRGLAINPRGADGNELAAATRITETIAQQTLFHHNELLGV